MIEIAGGIVLAILFIAALPFMIIAGLVAGLVAFIYVNADFFTGLLILVVAGVCIYLVGVGLYYLIPWVRNGMHGGGWTAKTRRIKDYEATITRMKARGYKTGDLASFTEYLKRTYR